MSKRTRRSETKVAQSATQSDARKELSARVAKTLRSAEAMKLRQDVIHIYNREIEKNVLHQSSKSRPAGRKSMDEPQTVRRVPSESELRKSPLSPQVRNELQDAARALACNSRRTRKEVMFALRRTGKAGRGNKKARWTPKSYVRCK